MATCARRARLSTRYFRTPTSQCYAQSNQLQISSISCATSCRPQSPSPMEGIAWVRQAPGVTLLKRIENEGMDFAAHNTTMTYAMEVLKTFWAKYNYFLFLNSSIKGPFTPKYYPFHWSEPFLSRINSNTKAIGSSIVCLPEVDAGTTSGSYLPMPPAHTPAWLRRHHTGCLHAWWPRLTQPETSTTRTRRRRGTQAAREPAGCPAP